MTRHVARALVVLLALAAPALIGAQTVGELERIVDLEATIKSLAEGVERGEYEAPAKFVILNGTLSSVFDADEESATVVIEMVTGEWIGLEDVKSYHCLVRFEGPGFFAAFPKSAPRDPGPEVFVKSARMLVVAFPAGVVELADGRLMWLLDGIYLRRL